jgi:hypothetical protein
MNDYLGDLIITVDPSFAGCAADGKADRAFAESAAPAIGTAAASRRRPVLPRQIGFRPNEGRLMFLNPISF